MGLFDENVDPENGVTLDPNPALDPLASLGLSAPPPPMAPVGPPTPQGPAPQGAPQGPMMQRPVPPGAQKPGGFGKILEMALLGLAAGLGPRRGGGIPQGIMQAHREGDAQRQLDYKNQQVAYDQQQQDLAFQQRAAEARQTQKRQAIETMIKTVPTFKTKADYDQFIEQYGNLMVNSGLRELSPLALRTQFPYTSPDAPKRAKAFLDTFFNNPLVKEQLKNDPSAIQNGTVQFDRQGDGKLGRVTLQDVMSIAGVGVLVDDQNNPVGMAPSTQGDKFQVALKAEIAQFRAEKRRAPDPKEVLALVEKASKVGKDTESADQLKALQIQGAGLANQLKEQQISSQPTPDQIAMYGKLLVEHKMSPSQIQIMGGGMGQAGRNFLRQVQAEALKQDPNFNFEEAESSYQLVKSPSFQNTVRYMDSVVESLPRLQQTANKLANGRVRGINSLINAGKSQFNDVDLKKFKTDVLFVADEIAKILQGGGTGSGTSDAKLRQAGEIINTSDSPQAIAGALGEAKFLMANRRSSLTRGTYLDKPVVDPAQSAREKLMKR